MSRRRFLSTLSSVAVGASAVLGCGETKPEEHRQALPNVVLVVVDTLRADRLEATRNGIPVMPKLASFAKGSLWLEDATTVASWTKPSMVSIFTSLYPDVHHVQFGIQQKIVEGQSMAVDCVPPSLEMMARYLKAAGYATIGIQTNHQLQGKYGFEEGFDVYRFDKFAPAARATDAALEELGKMKEPFFLYVHYLDPHYPYQPPDSYRSVFGPAPELKASDTETMTPYSDYYLDKVLFDMKALAARKRGDLSNEGREYMRYMYDGECRYVDDEVARLLDNIEAKHGATAFVVTADHGEELWEHGSLGHSKTVYQEAIRVPLMVRLPGWAPARLSGAAETVDILPTLAGYIGLEERNYWQGMNLLPSLKTGKLAERPVYAETRGSLAVLGFSHACVTVGPEKLIRKEDRDGVREELYDLARDPREQQNLAGARPDAVARLRGLLEARAAADRGHALSRAKRRKVGLDEETQKALEALGYLGDR